MDGGYKSGAQLTVPFPPFSSYLRSGVWPFLLLMALGDLIVKVLDWWSPRCNIDLCTDFPLARFKEQREGRRRSASKDS